MECTSPPMISLVTKNSDTFKRAGDGDPSFHKFYNFEHNSMEQYKHLLEHLSKQSATHNDGDDSVVDISTSEDDDYDEDLDMKEHTETLIGERVPCCCATCKHLSTSTCHDMVPIQVRSSASNCSDPYELDLESNNTIYSLSPPVSPGPICQMLSTEKCRTSHSPIRPIKLHHLKCDAKANQNFPCPPTVSSIRNAVSHLTRLDDFNVIKLSHGYFSQVFKVTHFSTKKVMVLKMNKNFSNRGNALREIELLNKLNHPNIVAYMGTVVHEGALHPLLEYINHGTLEQLIRQFYPDSALTSYSEDNKPLRAKVHRLYKADWTFMKLMQDVCRGMKYLHYRGYLHRDLASKNVFIRKLMNNACDQGDLQNDCDDHLLEAVIGDFGFAISEPTPDHKLSTVGSPYWLAPECFKNQWYNHKCDIYSFGVICCELNWRIPADPDYLPRFGDNFAVDFNKLENKKDTLLARIALKACQIEPQSRPEFDTILSIFDEELHNESINCNANHNVCYETNKCTTDMINHNILQSNESPLKQDYTSSKGDIFDQHLLRRHYSCHESE